MVRKRYRPQRWRHPHRSMPTATRAALQGDPKVRDDLERAGAGRAAKALLLGGPRQKASEDESLQEGALADAEVIFAFQHLKTLNPDIEVYCQVRGCVCAWRVCRCIACA
jgi:hypothetical protein